MSLTNEKELLSRLQGGDEWAFRQIFDQYYHPLCIFAERLIGNRTDGEDIVEEVLLKLWTGKTAFVSTEHLKAYLFRCIRNAGLNHIKTWKHAAERQYEFSLSQDEAENGYLAEITRAEAHLQLHNAIASLPPQARKIITMTFIEGKSNEEVADLLRLSVNTIKAQKQRGLALLRRDLPEDRYMLLFVVCGGLLNCLIR